MAPNLDYAIPECRWQQQKVNCFDYFSSVMTEEGRCFAFNANFHDIYTDMYVYFDSTENVCETIIVNFRTSSRIMTKKIGRNLSGSNSDAGHNTTTKQRKYSNCAADAGQKYKLDLILSLYEHDHERVCGDLILGYKFALNVPGETNSKRRTAEISKNFRIIIDPKFHDISNSLRRLNPEQRNCFLDSERKLYFYKKYSEDNCLYECLANYTKRTCKCVPFYMPSKLFIFDLKRNS